MCFVYIIRDLIVKKNHYIKAISHSKFFSKKKVFPKITFHCKCFVIFSISRPKQYLYNYKTTFIIVIVNIRN